MPTNDRLTAALRYSPKRKPTAKRGFTAKTATAARKSYIESHQFPATCTMKIHADVRELALLAWPNCHDRVAAISSAIRAAAEKVISGQSM